MTTVLSRTCIVLVSVSALAIPASAENIVIDFESETPRTPSSSYWAPNPGFITANVTFSGGFYEGFAVSNSTATGSYGYLYYIDNPPPFPVVPPAEISAESNGGAGGGVASSNFAVGYFSGYIDLPSGYRPLSIVVTNTATTAFLLANSDPANFGGRPLGVNGDEFSVTFHGWTEAGGGGSEIGSGVNFVLGSFLNDTATIEKEWSEISLASLGNAASITLSFDSYDIYTPTYVAIDNLTIAPVPEPSTWALGAGAVAAMASLRYRWTMRARP